MEQTVLITALRQEIGDKEEPFLYDDPSLLVIIKSAIFDYSQYRPQRRRGLITLREDLLEYVLPDDYQTWITGLENYEVLDSTLYLDVYPKAPIQLTFTYLANHNIASLPDNALALILDYCTWKILSDSVREGAEISELKLGKGLDIKFGYIDELNKSADTRRSSYMAAVTKPIGGGT
jgi:hypothetical protein